VLDRLEAEARAGGTPVLRLETGIHQAPAIGLYKRCGFRLLASSFGHLCRPATAPHRGQHLLRKAAVS
jgi:ribosomal protein S18 acetylase RimI-like enzyme